MPLTPTNGNTTLDGSEDNLFSVVGTTQKHFAAKLMLNEMASGDTIRVRVYDRLDGVSYYKFDGDVTDYRGSNNGTITYSTNLKQLLKFEGNANATVGNNGTVTGTTKFISGVEGQGFSLDGASSISGSDTGFPSGNNSLSFSGWVNPSSFSGNPFVFQYGTRTTGEDFEVILLTSGKIQIAKEGTALLTTTSAISLNVWTHVAVTYDATTLKVYINGIQDATTATPTFGIILSAYYVGQTGSNSSYYTGLVDEFRVYNIALSASQVSALYMVGKYGQSHTFDGNSSTSGESISLGNPTNLGFEYTSPFSIAFWIKTTSTAGIEVIINKSNNIRTTGWSIWMNSGGNPVMDIFSASSVGLECDASSTSINDGNWHHVVCTYAGDGLTIKIYVDGSAKTTANNGFSSVGSSILNSNNVMLGIYPAGGGDSFGGQLDDLRIYDRILSSTDVNDIYTAPKELKSILYDRTYGGVQSTNLYIPFIQSMQYTVSCQQTSGNYYKTLFWEYESVT